MSDHVLSLDLSLTSSGAATIARTGRLDTYVKKTSALPCYLGHQPCPEKHQPSYVDVDRRITTIHRWFTTLLKDGTRLVILEGPSHNSKFGKPWERGQLFGRVVHTLVLNDIPFAVVPPSRMKWFITGNGNADKDLVKRAIVALYPHQGLHLVDDDQIDAVGLGCMGQCWLGWDGPWFDARALTIEQGVQWPDREAIDA